MSRMSFTLRDAAAPPAALELGGRRVSGAVLERRAGHAVVAAHASEPLPEHALVPALNAANVRDREPVVAAVRRVLERLGRPRRVGLVIPDPVAKVSLVRLQQVPPRAHDLEQVLRWQVRRSAPFAIDDAQVSCVPGLQAPDEHEFIVTLARRDVVREYEDVCASAGTHAGIVDLSTFNVANAVLAGGAAPEGDWLLVNVAADWSSVAIFRGTTLVVFRSRSADADGSLADLVHQTAMYYEDRLGGAGFSRVLQCGVEGAAEVAELRSSLGDRLSAPIDVVDPTRAASVSEASTPGVTLLETLSPLVGMMLRGEEAA